MTDTRPSIHVLLVDDDPAVARVLARMLRADGMIVSPHLASETALHTFATTPDAFDLALIDRRIPAISGPRLAYLLWQLRPRLPILFISGDLDRLDLQAPTGPHCMLAKPVTAAELVRCVRELVSERT